jgi:hypothetical protein
VRLNGEIASRPGMTRAPECAAIGNGVPGLRAFSASRRGGQRGFSACGHWRARRARHRDGRDSTGGGPARRGVAVFPHELSGGQSAARRARALRSRPGLRCCFSTSRFRTSTSICASAWARRCARS